MTEEIEEVEVEILPNNECKDLVFTGEIVDEDPMEEILHDADEQNSKRIAEDLQELGALYEDAMNTIALGKHSAKSVLDRGKDIGITKRMIEAYISMKNFNNLNRFAIWGAINEEQE